MSELVNHAKRELALLNRDNDEMQDYMNKDILEVLEVISKQGHSGFSLSYLRNTLNRLLDYQVLTPLTGEESEWGTEASELQNNRDGSVFRDEDDNAHTIVKVRYTDDNGKSWFTGGGNLKQISFPYWPTMEVEKEIYLDEQGNTIKVIDYTD